MPEIKQFFEALHALANVARDFLAVLQLLEVVRTVRGSRRHKH